MQSLAERVANHPQREALLADIDPQELEYDWRFWARPNQLAPEGDWRTWLALAGRGFGKTEAGAQWIRQRVKAGARNIALIAETQKDLEEVMVARLLKISPPDEMPRVRYKPVRLTWPNGAQALGYNGTEPDQLRGPEFDTAWIDELCLVSGTMIATGTGLRPIEAIRPGEQIWTRKGLRPVVNAWMSSPSAEVWEITTAKNLRLIGTANHPVWTEGNGFTPLRSLQIGDMLAVWENNAPNAPNGGGRRGIFTAITTAIAQGSSCTGRSISRLMARLMRRWMSIMSMATRLITTLQISPPSLVANICGSMGPVGSNFGTLSAVERTRKKPFGGSELHGKSPVHFAESLFSQLECGPSFAAQTAELKHFANETPVTASDTLASLRRLPRRAAVYNIEVAGEPEYFANGILTHNCKYRYARETWDMLQFTMRSGTDPRVFVTTTPRPIPVLREIIADPSTVVTRGSTMDNAKNLAPAFMKAVIAKYEGTRLGRQELNAEMLDDVPGALWTRDMIDAKRVKAAPDMRRIVIAVDPSGTAGAGSEGQGDDVGIIAAGLGTDGRGYVLEDYSCNLSPDGWARRVREAYTAHKADRIVAERNFGGAMVEAVIKATDKTLPVTVVTASRGKIARAEPIAALYEQQRVSHVGSLPSLEDQMCAMTPSGYVGEGSPDRADALVWALTELMLTGSSYNLAAWG